MPRKIIAEVSDTTYQKLAKRKAEDGFEGEEWGDWLRFLVRDVHLTPSIREVVERGSKSLLPMWMRNFAENLPIVRDGRSIRELMPEGDSSGRAVVIGRGPSVFKKNHIEMLRDSGFDGAVVATDGILIDCLKRGLVPDYVLSIDGAPVCEKWYDDPIVAESAPKIASVLNAHVSPNVVHRVLDTGFKGPYWFVPSQDDAHAKGGITRMFLLMTCGDGNPDGHIAMRCLGNVGATSWVFAWSVLKRREIALIGMDYGYPEDMPLGETYYWDKAVDTVGALNASVHYEKVWHPVFRTVSYIDPAFETYRQAFYEALLVAPSWVNTANCTEGGTLFHPRLKCMLFREWLDESG